MKAATLSLRLRFKNSLARRHLYTVGRHIAPELKYRPHDVNPSRSPVLYLIADKECERAADEFCRSESLKGRFTFFYDCSNLEVGALPEQHLLDRAGVHFIYKPQLTSKEIITETWKNAYFGVRAQPTLVHQDVRSYCDQSILANIDNFKERLRVKLDLGEWYTLLNSPGAGVPALVEWTQQALFHAFGRVSFNSSTLNSTPEEDQSQSLPEQARMGELRGKRVAILGMDYAGVELARQLVSQNISVTVWAGPRPKNTSTSKKKKTKSATHRTKSYFSRQDAALMGVHWKATIPEAVLSADAICVFLPANSTPDSESSKSILNHQLFQNLEKDHVALINASQHPIEASVLREYVQGRSRVGQSLKYYARVLGSAEPASETSAVDHVSEDEVPADVAQVLEEEVEEEKVNESSEAAHASLLALQDAYPDSIRISHDQVDIASILTHTAEPLLTAEAEYNATMVSYTQLSDFIWKRKASNVLSNRPEGFLDLGAHAIKGIGPVNTRMVNKALDNPDLLDQIKVLHRLLKYQEETEEDLTPAQAKDYHRSLHKIVRSYTSDGEDLLKRPFRD